MTDPIWSERASPLSWLGPKRVALPGVDFRDLPPIDRVLLSHNHYDHMDLPTLKKLDSDHQPSFFVPKGNANYLRGKGIKQTITELDWWDEIDFNLDYCLHCVPARHFSARGIFDRNRTLWGGFVIKGAKYTIYFAGDTGFGPHFAEIRKRLGPPSLSFLPIGAYKPCWFMHSVHQSPGEAVNAHSILKSRQSMAIHFGTFQLADEEFNAPMIELRQALDVNQLSPESFWILKHGESRSI